jgi:MoxR-like ATPase
MSSSTVEAIKKAAMDRLRSKEPEEAVALPVKEKSKPLPPTSWPSVLKNAEGQKYKRFSVLFPEAKSYKGKDFDVPVFHSYPYPDALAASVQDSSDYVANSQLLYDAVLAFTLGSVTHVVGPPGTGKTNGLPVLMSQRLGLPLLRLSLNKKGMMLDDLIGREAIKTSDAGHMETGHKDGVLCGWVEHPCIVTLDEFSRANTEMTNGLMSLMERDGKLIVENRTHSPVIKRHKWCWLVAADNVKGLGDQADRMIGTDIVDGAVLDRFEITLEVDYLPEKVQESLLQTWYPGFPEAEGKKIVQFGKQMQDAYKKGLLPLSFSPRALKEVGRYACIHEDVAIAIQKVVVNKFADEADIEALKNMFRTAFGKGL